MTVTENEYIKGIREDVDGINKVQPFSNKEKQINNLLQKYPPESCERDYIQKYSELQINVFNSIWGESSYVIALLAVVISSLQIWSSVYYPHFFEHKEEIVFMFIIIDFVLILALVVWLFYIIFKKRPLKDIIMAIVEEKLLKKIQVNGFHSKNTSYECNELEELVDRAIKDELCIVFKNLKTEKCKYIQKVAETRLSEFSNNINGMILLVAFGLSLAILFIFNKSLIESIGFFCGIIILIFCIWYAFKWKSKYTNCSKIILTAERELIWMEIESKKSHSDTGALNEPDR